MRVEKHDGTNVVTVDSTGNVGIGIVSATQKLHVVGNICYTGSSSSCSDLRYKKDITVLPNVLEKLEQINGVSYYWKTQNFPEKGFEDKKQIGVIAQELELVYPELVITDANGYKTVDYPKLTAVLIEAVKTQYSKTQIVEVENRELKERVGSYESRLQKIEAVLNFQDKTER